MSPLMTRLFMLVGIALALASLQSKARAEAPLAWQPAAVEVAATGHQAPPGAPRGTPKQLYR